MSETARTGAAMFALKVERTSPLVATRLHGGTARQTTDILHVYSTPLASSPISPPTPPPLICFIPQCLLRTCLNTGIFLFLAPDVSRGRLVLPPQLSRSKEAKSVEAELAGGQVRGNDRMALPSPPNSVNGGGQNEPPRYPRKNA